MNFREDIVFGENHLIAISDDGEDMGFIAWYRNLVADTMVVRALFVEEKFRGAGVASAICAEFLEQHTSEELDPDEFLFDKNGIFRSGNVASLGGVPDRSRSFARKLLIESREEVKK